MQAESQMRPERLLELSVKSRSAEIRRKLDRSAHLGNHLDSRDKTFIRKFGLLLKQQLILLIVSGMLSVRQLPRDQVLITLIAVGPAVPLLGALVHNADDLVEELGDLSLQRFCDVNEAVDAHNKED